VEYRGRYRLVVDLKTPGRSASLSRGRSWCAPIRGHSAFLSGSKRNERLRGQSHFGRIHSNAASPQPQNLCSAVLRSIKRLFSSTVFTGSRGHGALGRGDARRTYCSGGGAYPRLRLGLMSAQGHERRIGANASAAGRPQTADPAGGQGGFRLGPIPAIVVRLIKAPAGLLLSSRAAPPCASHQFHVRGPWRPCRREYVSSFQL
jgi:hypothetical protein